MNKHILGIAQCSFFCKDFVQMLHFYRDILELEPLFILRDATGNPERALLRITDGQYIELIAKDYVGDNAWHSYSYSYTHLALVVEDIFQATKELERKGIPLSKGLRVRSEFFRIPYCVANPSPRACGSYTAWIQDPEGNEIEMMQYTSCSLQLLYK